MKPSVDSKHCSHRPPQIQLPEAWDSSNPKPTLMALAVACITTACEPSQLVINLIHLHCLCRRVPQKRQEASKAGLGQGPHPTPACAKSAEYLNKGLIYKVSHRKLPGLLCLCLINRHKLNLAFCARQLLGKPKFIERCIGCCPRKHSK